MAKPVGLPKSGGRQKGVPNKRTAMLLDALDSNGIFVVDRLSKLLPKLSAEKQADILMGLLPYIYPRRKSIEMDLAVNQPITHRLNMDDVRKIMSDPIAKLHSKELAKRVCELDQQEQEKSG